MAPFLIRRFGGSLNVTVIAPVAIVAAVVVGGAVLSAILLVVAMRLFEREKLVLS